VISLSEAFLLNDAFRRYAGFHKFEIKIIPAFQGSIHMSAGEADNQIRQVFSLSEITESVDQQPPGEISHSMEGPGEVQMPDINPGIEEEAEIKLGITTEAQTSPTLPKEGLGKVVNTTPTEKTLPEERNAKPGYITANEWSYPFIKEIRGTIKDNPTEAEKIMWELLRNKKTGHKIRRQHIIDNFITDFVCIPKRVVIEIDGKIHLKQQEPDELRTQRLNDLGFDVIRFTNEEVYADPKLVAEMIKQYLDKTPDHIFNNTTHIQSESDDSDHNFDSSDIA
jgi:very-short-patch-repair endonuclease